MPNYFSSLSALHLLGEDSPAVHLSWLNLISCARVEQLVYDDQEEKTQKWTLRGHPGVQQHYGATWTILPIQMCYIGHGKPLTHGRVG